MKTTKKLLLGISLIMIMTVVSAQDYNFGVGLRAGVFSSGVSFKGFVSEKSAIEGIAGFGRRSFVATGLYEYHIPITQAPGLNLFVGGGAHIGFFGYRGTYLIYKNKNEKVYVVDDGETIVVPGVDMIFGAEYKFSQVPIAVGMDVKPFLDFHDGVSAYPDFAISGRFVF